MKTYKTFKKFRVSFLSPIWYSEDIKYSFHFWYSCTKLFRQAGCMFVQSSKEFEMKENSQKFDFLFDLMRRKLHFSILISLRETFSPSTVNVRSKFWRIWKKNRTFRSMVFWLIFWDEDCNFQFWYPCRKLFRQARWMFVQKPEEFEKKSELSEIWFFDWSFETKTAIFNFDIPAEMFFAKHGKCSFKVLKNLKKRNFQKFGFLIDLLRRRLQFSILISLPNFFSPTRWMFVQKPEEFEKKQYFQKFCFLIDILRRRLQFSILISLPKCFSPSTVNVRSNFWRIWKKKRTLRSLIFWFIIWDEDCNFQFWHPCRIFFAKHGDCLLKNLKKLKKNQNFQKLFFYSKCSFGQVECSFDKQVKIFPPTFKKVSL